MSVMKITLIGFSNYLEGKNDDLFEYLTVPTGIDKDLLVNNILLRGGEFEVLYADPNFLKNMIGVWSSKWQHTMERWINALSIDYNPLENYDKMEEWEDKGHRLSSEIKTSDEASKRNNVSQSLNSNNSSDTQTRTENAVAQDISHSSGSGSTENKRSSYDEGDPVYSPHDKAETSSSGDNTSNGITSANGTTTNTGTGSNALNALNSEASDINTNVKSNSVDNSNGIHTGRMHGNIGVTTSQQMLEAELDISKWNIYEEITDLFLNEFCIYLY